MNFKSVYTLKEQNEAEGMKDPTPVFGEGGEGCQPKACSENWDNKAELTPAVMRAKE